MPEEPRTLAVDRSGAWTYVARNDRGGEVRIGVAGAADSFTPGELLQLAVATCGALSADHVLASRLGEDFEATLLLDALTAPPGGPHESRYTHLSTQLLTDMSALPPDRRDALVARAEKAIERLCAVARTVERSATTQARVIDQDPAGPAT